LFTLYLNNKQVFPQSKTSIKLTRENPVLSSGGDYTLDVTLPLKNEPRNVKALNLTPLFNLQSNPLPTATEQYEFKLYCGVLTLTGTARVTQYDEENAKLQLTANAAQTVADAEAAGVTSIYSEAVYVDDLVQGVYFTNSGWGDAPATDYMSRIARYLLDMANPNGGTFSYRHAPNGSNIAVLFPIYNAEEDVLVNPMMTGVFIDDSTSTDSPTIHTQYSIRLLEGGKWNTPQPCPYQLSSMGGSFQYCVTETNGNTEETFAFQPYFYLVIEKIMSVLGYTLEEDGTGKSTDVLATDWRSRVFIANARPTQSLKAILPHWTLKEFFAQVSRFFGVQFIITGKSYKIVNRLQGLTDAANSEEADTATNYIRIDNIVNEFTAEVDKDYDDDLAAEVGDTPVNYAFAEDNNFLKLSDDLVNYCGINTDYLDTDDPTTDIAAAFTAKRAADTTDTYYIKNLRDFARKIYYAGKADDKTLGYYVIIFKDTEITDDTLSTGDFIIQRIGMYHPLNRTATTDGTSELKIVPCRQVEITSCGLSSDYANPAKVYLYHDTTDGIKYYYISHDYTAELTNTDRKPYTLLLTTGSVTAPADETALPSDIICDETEIPTDSKLDVIEVAYVPLKDNTTAKITYKTEVSQYKGTVNLTYCQPLGTRVIEGGNKDYEYRLPTEVYEGSFPNDPHDPFRIEQNATTGISVFRHPASVNIDSRVIVEADFLDNLNRYDPSAIYLLHGKPHLCQKLELTITPVTGLNAQKKGYFIPIN